MRGAPPRVSLLRRVVGEFQLGGPGAPFRKLKVPTALQSVQLMKNRELPVEESVGAQLEGAGEAHARRHARGDHRPLARADGGTHRGGDGPARGDGEVRTAGTCRPKRDEGDDDADAAPRDHVGIICQRVAASSGRSVWGVLNAPWPRTLYAYVLLRKYEQEAAFEREAERIDAMRKMHAAIVAAFSPDKARDIMEGVVSDLTSRIESARDATPKSDRLTKQFEEERARQ